MDSGLVVVDSTVVIDLLHDHPGALSFAGDHPVSRWTLHPVVEAELLTGVRNTTELRALDRALRSLPRLRMNPVDADHALAFVRRHTLSHGVGWPDCLIAATAMRLGLPVATTNVKHFRAIRGLKVVRPY